jgi:hypothetical protein
MDWGDLDEDVPLDEGADTTAWVECPYCGEEVELVVDPGGGAVQQYTEDCDVCCQPLELTVRWDDDGTAHARAATEDDG